ncbi:MAG: TIGR01777 family oxidoreductase [Cyclobacteriaceae bacterium]|nr:TIGR01777 family oxidoreductase [Cyclobacteriaceae bacterium]UYN88467.1 MAG: TIGR01777 family oxidoreductase [Cyclobacteriaceae bacterium]
MPKRILITGASGLVGTELTANLIRAGYQVVHLGRSKRHGSVPSFTWDVDKGIIEEGALQGIDTIIHLAGAGIADKPWTARRKQEILESRTRSSALLYQTLKSTHHQVKSFISASAIGYYGFGGSDEVFTESSEAGTDFLADVVKAWEHEVDKIQELNIRTVKIRIGIVLADKGGALKEIAKPVRYGIGAPLGSGKQPMSWIHIDDLCMMFRYAIENENLIGAYNGVSSHWSTNREVTKAIAKALHRTLLLPPVPSFVMKLMLGEMANLVLLGSKVSAEKILQTGFKFQYEDLTAAIESFYRR